MYDTQGIGATTFTQPGGTKRARWVMRDTNVCQLLDKDAQSWRYLRDEHITFILINAFHSINEALRKEFIDNSASPPSYRIGGCTATVTLQMQNTDGSYRLITANLGDSKTFFLEEDKSWWTQLWRGSGKTAIRYQTIDLNANNSQEQDRIGHSQIYNEHNENRVKQQGLHPTRTFGDFNSKNYHPNRETIIATPVVTHHNFPANHSYFVLHATDGIYVSPFSIDSRNRDLIENQHFALFEEDPETTLNNIGVAAKAHGVCNIYEIQADGSRLGYEDDITLKCAPRPSKANVIISGVFDGHGFKAGYLYANYVAKHIGSFILAAKKNFEANPVIPVIPRWAKERTPYGYAYTLAPKLLIAILESAAIIVSALLSKTFVFFINHCFLATIFQTGLLKTGLSLTAHAIAVGTAAATAASTILYFWLEKSLFNESIFYYDVDTPRYSTFRYICTITGGILGSLLGAAVGVTPVGWAFILCLCTAAASYFISLTLCVAHNNTYNPFSEAKDKLFRPHIEGDRSGVQLREHQFPQFTII